MAKRPLKVFRYSVSMFHKVGYAASRAAFQRLAGLTAADMDYVSITGNSKEMALAEEAGEGHYMEWCRTTNAYVRRESKETIAKAALDAAKEMAAGSGNAPPVRIERGAPQRHLNSSYVNRLVYIGDEERGYWSRIGNRWTLYDTTGHAVQTTKDFYVSDGEMREFSRQLWRATMEGWDEAVAFRHVMQAWEDDQLPSIVEQQARAEKRKRAAEQQKARKAALERLLPEYEALERVLKRAAEAGVPEAAFVLDTLNKKDEG